MSIFGNAVKGVSKFAVFMWHVIVRTPDVLAVLSKIAPATLVAILAVFYDIVKFFTVEAATVGTDVAKRDFTSALGDILSQETQTLLSQIIADSKTVGSVIESDIAALKALGNSPTA